MATTYFIKNGGSDAAPGTSDAMAWATLAKVNAFAFTPGDSISFKRGHSWNLATDAALVAKSGVTYNAYGTGAQPILDGMGTVAQGFTASSKSNVIVDSLNIKRNTSYNALFASCDTCSITNSTLSDAGVHSVNVTGASPTFTATGNMYSTSAAFHMTGKVFNIASTSASVSTISSNTIDVSQVLSTDNVSGIVCSASPIGCVIDSNTITGAQMLQGFGIKSVSASGSVTGGQITRNSLVGITNACAGCDGEGIELTGDVTNQVTGTLVSGNYIKLGSAAADCAGLFHATSNVFSYNFCIGNSGTNAGIHPASNSDSNVFYGNSLYLPGTTYGLEVTGTSINNDFQNNIVVGSGYGLIFASGGTGTFSYNIAFNNATANFSGGTNSGNNSTSDPLWISPTPTVANDFKLQATSPAIAVGNNLGAAYQFGNAQYGASFPYVTANQNSFGWGRGAFVFTGSTIQREVGSGQTYSTISAAMTAASSGDVVNIHSGTYSEQVTCKAGVTMQNNGTDTVNLQSTSSPVVTANSNCSIIADASGHLNITYNGSGSAPIGINHGHGSNIDSVTLTNLVVTIAGGTLSGFGIYIADCDLCTVTGTTVHISATTGTHDGMQFLFNSHLTVTDSTIYGEPCSSATHLEDGIVATGTDLIFRRLTMHDGCSFDNHPDAIVIQGDGDRSGAQTARVEISASRIGNFSQLIYIDAIHNPIGSGVGNQVKVFNNVLYESSAYRYGGSANKVNCAVFDGEGLSGSSAYPVFIDFYNNTLDCKQLHMYGSRLFTGSVINIKNNVFLNLGFTGLYFPTNSGVTLDYNYYSGADATPFNWNGTNRSLASFKTFASPQEANSAVGTANLNTDYSEKSVSDTIGRGLVLSSIFTTDFNGTTRSTPWDIGAFQIASGSPGATLSLSSLSFGSVPVSSSSSPQVVTLTNTGGATLNISGITFTTGTQYSKTTTCGATLASSASCTVSVTFSPLSSGVKSDALNFADDASGSPQTVFLIGSGLGLAPPAAHRAVVM